MNPHDTWQCGFCKDFEGTGEEVDEHQSDGCPEDDTA